MARRSLFEQEMMDTPPGGAPSDAWTKALKQFRASLWTFLEVAAVPDGESFAAGSEALRKFFNDGVSVGATGVAWQEPNGAVRTVRLKSLFAECFLPDQTRKATVSALERADALGKLSTIAEEANAWSSYIERVAAFLVEQYGTDNPWLVEVDLRGQDPPNPEPEYGAGLDGARLKLITFAALRALNLTELDAAGIELAFLPKGRVREHSAARLEWLCGLSVKKSGQAVIMQRVLDSVLGDVTTTLTPATFISTLGTHSEWPNEWPLRLRSSIRQVLESLSDRLVEMRPNLRKRYWPEWIA